MEEAVRTSLLCVVFSVQARGRGGGKGKKACVASLSKLLFPSLVDQWGGCGAGPGSFSDTEMLQGEATCSVRVWVRESSS